MIKPQVPPCGFVGGGGEGDRDTFMGCQDSREPSGETPQYNSIP